jgi:hypothetical protein
MALFTGTLGISREKISMRVYWFAKKKIKNTKKTECLSKRSAHHLPKPRIDVLLMLMSQI